MSEIDPTVFDPLPAFAALPIPDRRQLLAQARLRQVGKGAQVFTQDGVAESFFLLVHGHCQVVKLTPDGQQVVVRYMSAGDFLGIAAAIGLDVYPASAVATVNCIVLVWPSSAWPWLAATYPVLVATLLRNVGGRLQESQARIVEMSTEQVERRIAHALLRLTKQAGRRTNDGIEIDFPLSRQDLAEMTGSTLHTVSRILSGWEKDGLVRSGRQRVAVTDPNRLESIAEG